MVNDSEGFKGHQMRFESNYYKQYGYDRHKKRNRHNYTKLAIYKT